VCPGLRRRWRLKPERVLVARTDPTLVRAAGGLDGETAGCSYLTGRGVRQVGLRPAESMCVVAHLLLGLIAEWLTAGFLDRDLDATTSL
jgi:hypothetical protein